MKRYIKDSSSDESIYVLNVVMDIGSIRGADSAAMSIAASENYIKRNPRLIDAYQLLEEQIKELNHLIHRVIETLVQHDFDIVKHYQSSLSYTYYVRFIPTDLLGRKPKNKFQIQFEIRDHIVNSHPTEGQLGNRLFVRAFYVGDKTCFDTTGTFEEIRHICDRVKRKDYSDFILKNVTK